MTVIYKGAGLVQLQALLGEGGDLDKVSCSSERIIFVVTVKNALECGDNDEQRSFHG